MEQLFFLVIFIIISAGIASLGKDRKIGFGWSFVLCLFLSPVIGLIITLLSKKKNKVDFVDINNTNKKED
ncbi:hypothetical protein [Porphyromonas gulae]|uniref:hypothetical protein n=1 Tax=Porphyromonas gulae TaxID=111105 RepID=UPI00052D2C86|nr:hypothetical protein [Porphyromonas gulae]KGN89304.1 hypothetical protein HQ46_05405 [Porphyromonas gulae]KKC50794.1 hypothetical protein HR10_07055 [Porphyromonas gulae]